MLGSYGKTRLASGRLTSLYQSVLMQIASNSVKRLSTYLQSKQIYHDDNIVYSYNPQAAWWLGRTSSRRAGVRPAEAPTWRSHACIPNTRSRIQRDRDRMTECSVRDNVIDHGRIRS